MTFPKLDSGQQPSIAPYCLRASAWSPTLSPAELGRCPSSAAGTLCSGQTRQLAVTSTFTKLPPRGSCCPHRLQCPPCHLPRQQCHPRHPHTSSNATSPMIPSVIPSTRYNQVNHFIVTHLLSTYYVPDWLKVLRMGEGGHKMRHICLQSDGPLRRCM